MGQSSPSTQTVRNETVPDPITQQWRGQLFNAAGSLYNKGTPDYYPGQTVVPFSQQTQTGLNALESQAAGGAPNLQAANDSASRALSGNNPAMAGAEFTARGGLSNPYAGALQQYGSGQNPHLKSMFDQGASQVTDAVNGNFMQAGRFGSNAAHTGALTKELGNLWSNINMPAYEAERDRGLQAAAQTASIGAADRDRQLQGLDLQGGLYSQANQDAARQQALLPSIFQYGAAPGQQMVNVGGAYEGLAGEQMADQIARYDYQNNAPWAFLNNYSSVVNGLPNLSSTSTSTQAPGRSRSMGALGGAMSGASMGSSFGPWGAAIGAIGGGLFGAYA